MVEHSPKILASEEKATTTTTVLLFIGLKRRSRKASIPFRLYEWSFFIRNVVKPTWMEHWPSDGYEVIATSTPPLTT